ncbi:MAG: hypothetical protein HFF10_04095 [Angelakisella sp.]|jgi:hypothetical protein|nr:hypothetical protein [Angelakisella sp.]
MKTKSIFRLLPILLIGALLVTSAYGADLPIGASNMDIPIGASGDMVMVGTVEPTIMSVTMPTYVPFHIARAVQGDNKVISPRITVTNNSSVPVSLEVSYTRVDLSKLPGTTWNNGQYVGNNQIAIGFQPETTVNQMPTSLAGTKWLQANVFQNVNVMSLRAYGESTMYVVGTLGSAVPENNTFSVIPTFVVRQAR